MATELLWLKKLRSGLALRGTERSDATVGGSWHRYERTRRPDPGTQTDTTRPPLLDKQEGYLTCLGAKAIRIRFCPIFPFCPVSVETLGSSSASHPIFRGLSCFFIFFTTSGGGDAQFAPSRCCFLRSVQSSAVPRHGCGSKAEDAAY